MKSQSAYLSGDVYLSNKCTIHYTLSENHQQPGVRCSTCYPSSADYICFQCALTCHKGHNLGEVTNADFCCKCGSSGLCKKTDNNNLDIVALNSCTFPLSGENYKIQYWVHCRTCFKDPSEGACMYCIKKCHAGHDVAMKNHSPFFCDCGAHGLCNNNKKKSSNLTSNLAFKIELPDLTNKQFVEKMASVLDKGSVYSPLSITFLLSMLHCGSAGTTEKQLSLLLGSTFNFEKMVSLYNLFNDDVVKMSNLILIDQNQKIKGDYVSKISKVSRIDIENFVSENLDSITEKCNKYIRERTNGKINDVIKSDMLKKAVMVLVNVICFKAKWMLPFDKTRTQIEKFNDVIFVEMMKQDGAKLFPFWKDECVKILEMTYMGGDYCMGFILPHEGVEFKTVFKYLSNLPQLKSERVSVSVPKFTQRKNIKLVSKMQTLGLTEIFDKYASNLNLMNDDNNRNLYVSELIHEAVVIVDESGTEAHAVTVAVARCVPTCAIICETFYANRSFVYYIKHMPTGLMMFIGDFHGELILI
ncbi:MAG: serpin [Satyrvirus sp.]|uniref:Serpin n=1 Tax=Satyrvirus sp. TaxID=2487771 RepID=A0A3G5ADF9_9VIRU|nr:MAG: serpin [Satyrvirus sp.]